MIFLGIRIPSNEHHEKKHHFVGEYLWVTFPSIEPANLRFKIPMVKPNGAVLDGLLEGGENIYERTCDKYQYVPV